MDLVNTFSGIAQSNLGTAIQYSVARKVLDAQQAEGAGILQLLGAATGGLQAGDSLVAAATGLGGQLDVTG